MWLSDKLEQQDYTEPELLLKEMLVHIGDQDPYLRDRLIYTAFSDMIGHHCLTDPQTYGLLEQLLTDSCLMYKIGNTEDDSVFTRSFSALVLALLLQEDRERRRITKEKFHHLLETALFYFVNESDKRGFTLEKGWAHSVAHGADLIDELVLHPLFEETFYDDVWEVLFTAVNVPFVYQDDEIERMSVPAASLMNRYPDHSLFTGKIEQLMAASVSRPTYTHLDSRTLTNIRSFLRALYFRAEKERLKQELEGYVKKVTFI